LPTQSSKTYTPQPEKDRPASPDSKVPAEKADRQKQKDSRFGIKKWNTTSYLPALSALERLPESDDEKEASPPKMNSINLSREQAQRARRGAEEAERGAEAPKSVRQNAGTLATVHSATISRECPQPALRSSTPPPLPAPPPKTPLSPMGTGSPRLTSMPACEALMGTPVALMFPPALPTMNPSHVYDANTGMWSYNYQATHYMQFSDPGPLRTA